LKKAAQAKKKYNIKLMERLYGEPESRQEQVMANPTGKGGFQPGKSGNPGGRPRETAEVRSLAREHTTEAVEALRTIMKDSSEPASARVAAANSLLDRGWGRAPQTITNEISPPGNTDAELPQAVQDLIATVMAGAPGAKVIDGVVIKDDGEIVPALLQDNAPRN
jgi:hypothetical protein